jgi:hypothetical protein
VERAPGVSVGDDAVKTNLVEVGCLELQHLEDTGTINLVRDPADLWLGIITTES